MVALNIPLITWCIIVAVMTGLVFARLFHKIHISKLQHQHSGHLLTIGSEREEFFIPGDAITEKDDAIDDVDS